MCSFVIYYFRVHVAIRVILFFLELLRLPVGNCS